MEKTLEKIKTKNRSIGQKLGKVSKLDAREIQICTLRKHTLETYKHIIEGSQGVKQFVSTPKKTGKGLKNKIVDAIYYPSVDDFCTKLAELLAAKKLEILA